MKATNLLIKEKRNEAGSGQDRQQIDNVEIIETPIDFQDEIKPHRMVSPVS